MTSREKALEVALRQLVELIEWADKNQDTISSESIAMDMAREALDISQQNNGE